MRICTARFGDLLLFYCHHYSNTFSLFLSMAESGGIPDGYSGGSVSTCLLYCCVRVFVWWHGTCVLKLVSSTYV